MTETVTAVHRAHMREVTRSPRGAPGGCVFSPPVGAPVLPDLPRVVRSVTRPQVSSHVEKRALPGGLHLRCGCVCHPVTSASRALWTSPPVSVERIGASGGTRRAGRCVHSPPDSRGAAKHLLLADVRWLACRDRVTQQRPATDGGLLQQRVAPFRDSRSVRKVVNVGASALGVAS